MGEVPVITNRSLIERAQAAIRLKRLGIQNGATEPLWIYPDGSVCAIASALPDQVLQQIATADSHRLKWLELIRAGYFRIAGLVVVEALVTFEIGYEFCCIEDADLQPKRTRSYLDYLISLDGADPPAVWPSEVTGFGDVFGSGDFIYALK